MSGKMISYNICEGHSFRIVIGILMLALLTGGAEAATLTVDAGGSATYTRIQDAINAANNGDIIEVASGTYNENIIVNKSVNLIGVGADVTIVEASDPNDHVFNITADYVNISGFTATGATGGAGINVDNVNYTNISNNRAFNCWKGIWLRGSRYNNLINNIVSSNREGIGIYGKYDPSSYNTLTGNYISDNEGDGIVLFYSAPNILNRNVIINNSQGIYEWVLGFSTNTIYDNIFNNTVNLFFENKIHGEYWNVTKISGTNIIGGPYLGGNFWANPDGTGFSQTCADGDFDGICDSPYVLNTYNIDYLPLAVPVIALPPPPAPELSTIVLMSTGLMWIFGTAILRKRN